MSSITAKRVAVAAASASKSNLIRTFTTSTSSSSSAPSTSSPTAQLNPLHAITTPTLQAGGLNVSQLARPGGRQSVSGIVATVFGGSGLLGRYVINNLGRIGSQVVAPYRGDGLSIRHVKLAGDLGQVVVIPNDFTDIEAVRRCVARSNVVINCIGAKYETDHFTYDDVHCKMAYRIAQVSKAVGVERFIQVSAFGADAKADSSFYKSKGQGEQIVREFYPDATIVRPTVMYGPGDKFLSYYAYMGHKLAAVPITRNGARRLQPVFVGDVSRAILNAIADPSSKGQIYEFAGEKVYTEAEIIGLVAKHTSSEVSSYSMSDHTAKIYGAIVGGRRNINWNVSRGLTPFAPFINTCGAFLNKFSYPSIYHPDMVKQAHVDLVLPRGNRLPGLKELGIEDVMPMENQLDRILFPHRLIAPDRFPEAGKMKRDAMDIASD